MNTPLFYKQKGLFAVDIGSSTVKVVQLRNEHGRARLSGYGYADIDPSAIKSGEIIKIDPVASALKPLIENVVIGKLTTDRLIAPIPTSHVFLRLLELQGVPSSDLTAAVQLEAQQYVPLPAEEIYLDYEVLGTKEGDKTRILMVATPKKIVDSYMGLFKKLELEVIGFEPSLLSIMRSVNFSHPEQTPKVIVDLGSESSDLAIYDGSIRLTSTTSTGGNHITKVIMDVLGVKEKEAQEIKFRHGISKSKWQEKLAPALSPILSSLANEVQKMLRYYHEQADTEGGISEIMLVGGGANLPGLSDFLTHLTGIKVITCNPWDNIKIKPLQPPHRLETTLYATSVGAALKELEK